MTSIGPFSTATEMLAALRDRKVSSVELVAMHRERYERFNPELNAIVIPTFELAEETAAESDAAREHSGLLGLPFTTKESNAVAGFPQTAGITDMKAFIAPETSELMRRVFASGAVLIGKTNIPPFLADWQADSPIYGRTVNPWDHTRTPGGSTGGGSAALAAGLTPLEFGSDIGGSIRVPAAYCGLYGHRPSETAVPRSGSYPPSADPKPAAVMGVQGPLARSAEDLELALRVISGPEPGEDQWRLEFPEPRAKSFSGLRVAVLPAIPWLPVDSEIVAGLDELAALLSRKGAKVTTAAPDFDLQEMVGDYSRLLQMMMTSAMPTEQRAIDVAGLRARGTWHDAALADGMEAGIGGLFVVLGARERIRQAWRRFFRDYDVLLSPMTLGPAFPHEERPQSERTATIDGQEVPYYLQIVYAALATFPGLGATAFPAGLHSSGLPIGLQVVGPYLEDLTPIRFAGMVAREIGGFTPPPRYARELVVRAWPGLDGA